MPTISREQQLRNIQAQLGGAKQQAENIKRGIKTLPSEAETLTKARTLPGEAPVGRAGQVMEFGDVLKQVVGLARQKRNKTALDILGKNFDVGVAPASSFAGILGDITQAGEKFGEKKIDELLGDKETTFDIRNIGGNLYELERDSVGRVVGQRVVIGGEGGEKIDLETATDKDIKTTIRETFAPKFKNQILEELNNEQTREFMIDYTDTQIELQQSIMPDLFLKEWKKEVGVDTKTGRTP